MSEAENKRRMQQVFSELAAGNGQPFFESLADDVEYTVAGTNSWSKTYVGKRSVLEQLFVPLRKALGHRPRTVPERVLADGEYVVVEARGDNLTKQGERYENRYCFVIRLREGRVQALTEYADTELVSRLLGARELGDAAVSEG